MLNENNIQLSNDPTTIRILKEKDKPIDYDRTVFHKHLSLTLIEIIKNKFDQ